VSPGGSNGFWIASLSYDTTLPATLPYAALEPRRRVQLARSSAFIAHVMGDRIYLSALGRSLEVIEIR
jgi:hypothetical protein